MKILKYFLILICLSSNSYADKTDSLEAQLQNAYGDEKIVLLIQLIDSDKLTLPEKIAYGEQALKLAEQSSNALQKAKILNQMGEVYKETRKNDKALDYFRQSLNLLEEIQAEKKEFAEPLLNVCIVYWKLDHYDKALDNCLKSLSILEDIGNEKGIADAYHHIGTTYDLLKNYEVALKNHFKARERRQKMGNKEGIAESFNSIGIIYYFTKKYKKAKEYYLKSLKIQEELDDKQGIAKALNNVGLIYKELGNNDKALKYYLKSIKKWKKIGDEYEIANVSNNIGELYTISQDYDTALSYLKSALKLAKNLDAKALVKENYEFLSNLYVALGNYQKALDYYKLSSELNRQIFNEKRIQKVANIQVIYETEKKEKEIVLLKKDNNIKQLELDRQTLQRNSLLGGLLFVFILAFVMFYLYRLKKKANARLRLEKAKSDKLLLNILPLRVANDLKETGKTAPESFENVTVYFSDIVGFTNLSSQLEPNIVISELNNIFTAFDNIIEIYQCERIKTIGDAYFCVCGMPEENPRHAENIIQSAIEIIKYLKKRNQTSPFKWEIRIGIHTGSVVGGVVGVKKYIYDVFGDAINTASRMESNSEPMKINISETTYEIVKNQFKTIERGSIHVKGKGKMKMYFIEEE
jgi:class 3 adenylate cyclase